MHASSTMSLPAASGPCLSRGVSDLRAWWLADAAYAASLLHHAQGLFDMALVNPTTYHVSDPFYT
jgi:hypothetical protein